MSAIRGSCSLWFGFDIGRSIDLDRSARVLGESRRDGRLELGHHAPKWFRFEPSPLRITQACPALVVGGFELSGTVVLTLFEFGAVSLAYEMPVDGELTDWIELSCALAQTEELEREARARVEALMVEIASAITRPAIADVVEDYIVFRWPESARGASTDELLAGSEMNLARLLRAEQGALSAQEIADALATRLSFQPNDVLLVDWNAALLIDDDADDVLRVLEFANVQLLELRFLDAELDAALDRAYELLSRNGWGKRLRVFGLHRDLDRVSTLQVDGAILFERVGNTLKLVGDQYLARVLRSTSQRFRSGEWNAGILRKLETLDDIYEKVHDHTASRRAEFLEWIIILLIAFEIAWALFGGG